MIIFWGFRFTLYLFLDRVVYWGILSLFFELVVSGGRELVSGAYGVR